MDLFTVYKSAQNTYVLIEGDVNSDLVDLVEQSTKKSFSRNSAVFEEGCSYNVYRTNLSLFSPTAQELLKLFLAGVTITNGNSITQVPANYKVVFDSNAGTAERLNERVIIMLKDGSVLRSRFVYGNETSSSLATESDYSGR